MALPSKQDHLRIAVEIEVGVLEMTDEDLLSLGHLEAVDDPDVIGHPLRVEAAAVLSGGQPIEGVLRVERRAFAEQERDHHLLVGDLRRHPVGRCQRHRRICEEVTAHVLGREVLAVLADPIVGATVEVQVAFLADDPDVPEVAGAVVTVTVLGVGGVGVLEVAVEEDVVRLDLPDDLADRLGVVADLAGGVDGRRRTRRAALAEHGDVGALDLADAVERVAWRHHRGYRRLGGAVDLVDVLHAEVAHQLLPIHC